MMKYLIYVLLLISSLNAKPLIVATSHPVAEIVREVTGSSAKVISLFEPGKMPHEHELTPQDIFTSNSALCVVYSSDFNESWVLDIPTKKINLSDFIPDNEKLFRSDSALFDFFWMDPILTKTVAKKLADTLSKMDEEYGADFIINGDKFGERCDFLSKMVDRKLKTTNPKPIFSDLHTLVYFAARYGLGGGRGFYSTHKISSDKLRDQFNTELTASGSGLIFYNEQIGDSIPRYLSGLLRVEVFQINVYGTEENYRYFDIINSNVDIIVEAMKL